MTKWIIIRVQWLYSFIIIVCPDIGYRKIAFLSHISDKAAGDIIRKEMHCTLSKVKEALTVEQSMQRNQRMPGWEVPQGSASPTFLGKSIL